jgi:glycosyltransferase involved in cell wall biosynthesis
MRIAFHAPLKAPDHPVPSGDRQMARLLLQALRAGGHEAEVVSTFRSFLPSPDPERMRAIEAGAAREAGRLAARFDREGAPDLWFTYHSHYKAPDLLGPGLAARFGRPYALAEASHAGKRAAGPWAAWHAANEAAIRVADRHLCLTARDAAGLAGLVAPHRIVALPPFLAPGPSGAVQRGPGGGDRVELVTVAMMRPGDKARSYAALADALGALPPAPDWRLTIVGDGPERPAVEKLFAGLAPARLRWAGERDAAGVAAVLAQSDLYVWPGYGEAYGLAYLEAAAAGLPVLAMECGGIASVVEAGVTGLLTPEGDVAAFTRALARLAADPATRARLGAAGRRMVREERTVARAAGILASALDGLAPRR